MEATASAHADRRARACVIEIRKPSYTMGFLLTFPDRPARRMSISLGRWGRIRRRGRTRRGLGARRRRREVAEEVGLRTDKRPRPPVLEALLIGLHRAVEGEKLGVRAISRGEDAVALAVALAANLLRLLLSLGEDDGDLAVGLGLDLLGLLRALRTVGRGALLPLGLHAPEHS